MSVTLVMPEPAPGIRLFCLMPGQVHLVSPYVIATECGALLEGDLSDDLPEGVALAGLCRDCFERANLTKHAAAALGATAEERYQWWADSIPEGDTGRWAKAVKASAARYRAGLRAALLRDEERLLSARRHPR